MKKYLSIGLVSVFVLFGLMIANSVMAIPTITTILSDSFGTGSSVNNIPNWDEEGADNDATTLAEAPSTSGENSASPDGGRFAKIGEDEWMCQEINASGYQNLNLSYYWRGDDQAESDDDGIVEYKAGSGTCDTSGWTQLKNHDLTVDNSWSNQSAFILSSGLNDSTFRLRFRAVSSADDEYFRIDSVLITGNAIPDTTVPTSSVTSPDEGDYLRGTITVTANASDAGSGVQSVVFHRASVDPTIIGSDTTAPYSVSWNTADVADGEHELWVDAYDNAGNHATSTTISVMVDNTAPTLYLPENIIMEATDSNGEEITFTASSTDNISPANPTVTCAPVSGSNFTLGTTTVNCSATDTAGNTANGSFTVAIQDTTSPEITAPGTQTFEATGPSTAPILTPATATDIADSNPVVTYDPTSFELGTTTVTWMATDASGNSTSTISEVIIVDTTAPTLTINGSNPLDLWINEDYEDYGTTATDLVDGDITDDVEIIDNTVDNAVIGTYHVIYKVTDASGNSTQETRVVYVIDKDKPIIHRIGGSPLTVEGGSTYNDEGATAIDQNGDDLTEQIVTNGLPINTMVLGTTTVTYDVMGYASTSATQAKRTVVVVDTTAPTITVDPLIVGLLVGDSYDAMSGVSASDTIGGDLTSNITIGGSFDGTGNAGSYTITYNVSDASGNNAVQVTRTVNIEEPDTTNPLITSVTAVDANTVEVIFNEELQNNSDGHRPTDSDFDPYASKDDGHSSYGITNVTYADKKVTIVLNNPILEGDVPRLYITPMLTSLVDLSGNYYNGGNSSDLEIVIDFSFEGEAPIITDETSAEQTTDSITITWTTDHPATSRVVYDTVSHTVLGSAPNYGYENSTVEDSATTTSHSVTITGLTSGTTYYIRTISHGSPETVSSEVTATTDTQSSGGSSSGSSSSGSTSNNSSSNQNSTSGQSDDDIIHLIGLLAVLGSQTEGGANIIPPVTGPELTPEVGIENGQPTTTAEEIAGGTSTENNLPLTAAVGTAGGFFGLSWWWAVVIVIIGGVLYFIYKKKV